MDRAKKRISQDELDELGLTVARYDWVGLAILRELARPNSAPLSISDLETGMKVAGENAFNIFLALGLVQLTDGHYTLTPNGLTLYSAFPPIDGEGEYF